jgi:GT2 family glycosyltransferase
MREFPCDYIAFLNNDIKIISPDWLSKLVSVAEKAPDAGIIGCKLLYPDNTIQHAGELFWPDRLRGKGEPADKYDSVEELQAVTFATVLINCKLLKKIGLFDEIFSPYYCEDVDLCFRARKSGFKVIYDGNVSLYHLEGGTIKGSDERDYVIARNAIVFYARYAPFPELLKMMARVYVRLIVRRADKRRELGKENAAFLLSLGDIVRLPYRILLMSAAIAKGLVSYGSSRVPSVAGLAILKEVER